MDKSQLKQRKAAGSTAAPESSGAANTNTPSANAPADPDRKPASANATTVAATASTTTTTTAATTAAEKSKNAARKAAVKQMLKQQNAAAASVPQSTWMSKVLLYVMTGLAFVTRFYSIDYPAQVVFDEVHFGKFASYYLRRTYYFDVHPPLGRLLFAAVGYYIGYDGHYDFDKIGGDYVENKVPYVQLRAWPAFCGAMVVPFAFEILRELGYSLPACCLAAAMIVFDNTLIAQSRLILLDSMLMLFMTVALYCWVKFCRQRRNPFSPEWWMWLLLTGVSLGFVMGVKMVGLFTVATIGVAVLIDLWHLLGPRETPRFSTFIAHFMARAVCLIVVPIALYLTWFWVHFTVLTRTGPGDVFMSPTFQSTLIGNKMSGQSQVVLYGANVTLKHFDTAAYLHSHINRYPLRYDDGRVSSQGQQVTGYPHKDDNNLFRLKQADPEVWTQLDDPEAPHQPLKHNDIVVLEHVYTKTHLLTHDVASPHTTTNQEFTAVAANSTSRHNETLFRVEIDHGKDGDWVKTLGVNFRLIHVKTGVAMYTHKKPLPEWGFGQQEINGNKKAQEKGNLWLIEDVQNVERSTPPPKGSSDASHAKGGDDKVARPSFLKKFVELQALMISHNAGLTKPHPYQSPSFTWPFVNRGISFWQLGPDRQIYLLPNPVAWWGTLVLLGVYLAGWFFDKMSMRREAPFLEPAVSRQYNLSAGYLFMAWCFHYLPFFGMGRSLFLHHYLPAAIIAFMVAGTMYDFILQTFLPRLRTSTVQSILGWLVTLTVIACVVGSFWFFSPLTYGNVGLAKEQLRQRKWLPSWDFQYA